MTSRFINAVICSQTFVSAECVARRRADVWFFSCLFCDRKLVLMREATSEWMWEEQSKRVKDISLSAPWCRPPLPLFPNLSCRQNKQKGLWSLKTMAANLSQPSSSLLHVSTQSRLTHAMMHLIFFCPLPADSFFVSTSCSGCDWSEQKMSHTPSLGLQSVEGNPSALKCSKWGCVERLWAVNIMLWTIPVWIINFI